MLSLSLKKQLFRSDDYREYLNALLAEDGRRGYKKELAEAAGCQPAYLSQVLAGKAELTPEQAESLSRFWGLSELESECFFQLVLLGRAGTKSLQDRLRKNIRRLRQEASRQATAFAADGLSEADRAFLYYSRWLPSALHVLLTVPSLQTAKALAAHLKLDLKEVEIALHQLEKTRLVIRTENGWKVTQAQIHSPETDLSAAMHHRNWRARALDRKSTVRYTSVHTLSRADFLRVRDALDEALRRSRSIIETSPEEMGACLLIDYFPLGE